MGRLKGIDARDPKQIRIDSNGAMDKFSGYSSPTGTGARRGSISGIVGNVGGREIAERSSSAQGLRTICRMELLVNVPDMGMNGVGADSQPAPNFLVNQPRGDQAEQVRLPRREVLGLSGFGLGQIFVEGVNQVARHGWTHGGFPEGDAADGFDQLFGRSALDHIAKSPGAQRGEDGFALVMDSIGQREQVWIILHGAGDQANAREVGKLEIGQQDIHLFPIGAGEGRLGAGMEADNLEVSLPRRNMAKQGQMLRVIFNNC